MARTSWSRLLISGLLLLTTCFPARAQGDRINLFTDCNCDENYIRQEIYFVNHVRDQALADIQLFIFDIRAGSGGRSYTLNFTGRNQFEGIAQELKYETSPNMTRDEVRKGLVKKIEQGMLPYLLASDLADQIQYSVAEQTEREKQAAVMQTDPWNNWIFELRGEGELERETSRSGVDLEFGFDADRVTEDWRIRMGVEFNHNENLFKSVDEEFVSKRQRHFARASVVRSLGSHWSGGIFGGMRHDTYDNLDFSYYFRPAIEYNIYPYREVLRREIVFSYRAGFFQNNYISPTIYEKKRETVFNHSVNAQARFRQPWGDIFTILEVSSFLHDFSKNRVELYSSINIRIFQGLAVRFSANLDLIRDQIYLPAGEASLEDILLRQRQIATNFELGTGIGLSYTFGSAFNNIVNNRL